MRGLDLDREVEISYSKVQLRFHTTSKHPLRKHGVGMGASVPSGIYDEIVGRMRHDADAFNRRSTRRIAVASQVHSRDEEAIL